MASVWLARRGRNGLIFVLLSNPWLKLSRPLGLPVVCILPLSFYNRIVDIMEELTKFTLLVRDHSALLTDRYSERIEDTAALTKPVISFRLIKPFLLDSSVLLL